VYFACLGFTHDLGFPGGENNLNFDLYDSIILCAVEIDRFSSQAAPAVEPVNFNRAR